MTKLDKLCGIQICILKLVMNEKNCVTPISKYNQKRRQIECMFTEVIF